MSPRPAAVELIRAKREGRELAPGAVEGLISGYLEGEVQEAQMAAFLMAVCWRGMSPLELRAWTAAMLDSGTRLDLSAVGRPTVDKHSTGGVGDKVSLALVPLVAACGAAVPQLSGRGLGHTGGTLDKLEAIPGWRAELSAQRVVAQLREVGAVICAASPELAPADRRLYALRDVTGTVESIPLIASSIMSKKLAEGTAALLLDVKVGAGAFMRSRASARELASVMMQLGRDHGLRTSAWLTAMDAPLGRAVGNGPELDEALQLLDGQGPEDLGELVLAQAREMVRLAGLQADPARELRQGHAAQVFSAMVAAQGGDLDQPRAQGEVLAELPSPATGFLGKLDALAVGTASWRLGAGRAQPQDRVSMVAGVICLAKPGERVRRGQPLLRLLGEDPARVPAALEALEGAVEVLAAPPPPRPLILERLPAP
ncbi:MAG: thymidine phosphorylase [Candidatus Dormibacteria bacterium]